MCRIVFKVEGNHHWYPPLVKAFDLFICCYLRVTLVGYSHKDDLFDIWNSLWLSHDKLRWKDIMFADIGTTNVQAG